MLESYLIKLKRESENVLSGEICTVPLDLFYPKGAMRRTAKCNLLNEINIKWYPLPSLMRILILVQLL